MEWGGLMVFYVPGKNLLRIILEKRLSIPEWCWGNWSTLENTKLNSILLSSRFFSYVEAINSLKVTVNSEKVLGEQKNSGQTTNLNDVLRPSQNFVTYIETINFGMVSAISKNAEVGTEVPVKKNIILDGV